MFDRIVEPNGPEPFKVNRAVLQRLAIAVAIYVVVVALKLVFAPDWRPGAASSLNTFSLIFCLRWIMQPGRVAPA